MSTILHLPGSAKHDDLEARTLVRTAAAAVGRPHLVYVSVVGADRVPVRSGVDRAMFGYYAAKHAAESVLLVSRPTRPTGKFPVGKVEKGESPRAAAIREVAEELGIDVEVTGLLVLDWAPHPAEGDKLLFIFDGGMLDQKGFARVALDTAEIAEAVFYSREQLPRLLPDRLARRVVEAVSHDPQTYLEHGRPVPAPVQANTVGRQR